MSRDVDLASDGAVDLEDFGTGLKIGSLICGRYGGCSRLEGVLHVQDVEVVLCIDWILAEWAEQQRRFAQPLVYL